MTARATPNRKQLRIFGSMMAVMITLIFGVALPWLWNTAFPLWPWVAAAVPAGLAAAAPPVLKPVYTAWMRLAEVLNWLVSHATLALVYYVVVVPMGAIMRLAGKDPMRRRFERDAATYRVPTDRTECKHLERPF